MKAVICAAGFGSRLKQDLPKAMVMIDGRRIIDYQLEALKDFDEIHVVVGYRKNLLMAHLSKHDKVRIIENDNPELGIRHTMRLIADRFDERVLILDGDILFYDQIKPEKHDYIGVKTPVADKPIYVNVDKAARATCFQDKATDHEWACVYQCNPSKINWDNEYAYQSLNKALPMKIKEYNLHEIDTDEDLSQAYAWLRKRSIKTFWIKRAEKGKLLWRDLTDLNLKILKPYLKKDKSLLDLGCGDCKLTNKVAKSVKSITAVDIIKRPEDTAGNIDYVCQDIMDFNTESKYDLITLFGVSNSLDEKEIKTLYERFKTFLAKDGTLIIKHQCGRERDVIINKMLDGQKYQATYRHYLREEKMLTDAGFKVNVIDPYPESENLWSDTLFKAFICTFRKK